ncbi:MAG: BCD family MFS transporter [Myxococcota bacterium]
MALSWLSIVRLGLVQTALGAIVVLSLSVMNRVMVVELQLAAVVPGFLVGVHHAVQISRPALGYRSDLGARRTPWIIGGMAVLALGSVLAAAAVMLMVDNRWLGLASALVAYLLIGIGVGAAGTTLLAMLASRVAPTRRAAAASIVWLMMIAGFIVTTGTTAPFLDPFSPLRLLQVTSVVSVCALIVAVVAILGVEGPRSQATTEHDDVAKPSMREVFGELWADPKARAFTVFVFLSMFAYGMQDLILEPFAGSVFGFSPGESTRLSNLQYRGVFWGMIAAGVLAGRFQNRTGSLRQWTTMGCVASGLALAGLALAGTNIHWPLRANVFALGLGNGAFAVAAIGWMMTLAGSGKSSREGSRMGLWGAAQAIGTALGGFLGAAMVDVVRLGFTAADATSYSTVFALEGLLFAVAALLAARMEATPALERNRVSTGSPRALTSPLATKGVQS